MNPPDSHVLRAAVGWLELGAPSEALKELSHVSPKNRSHPEAYRLRWRALAELKQWETALEVAKDQVRTAPDDPEGWINQSYALHELRRTLEALKCLLPLAKRFKNINTIPYNLACYACQLGQIPEAQHWLEKAVLSSSRKQIQDLALRDIDLKPLWGEIQKWQTSVSDV